MLSCGTGACACRRPRERRARAGAAARSVGAEGYRTTTGLYDVAVGRDFFARVVARFARLVRRHRMAFASAADVGCGTGLFARHLASAWRVPVFAVDRAEGMLVVARRRCAGLDVQCLRQDVRALRLPRPVGLITAHFDTLNHLTGRGDLACALRRVAANLAPRGWFYFDLVTPCAPLGGFDAVRRSVVTSDGRIYEQRARWLPCRRLIAVRARAARISPCGVALAEDRHWERAYGAAEIDAAIAAAGLVTRGVYDEASLAVAESCPPRLVIVAQKPG